MKRVGIFPTLVTAANGYCGVLAIYKVHDGEFYYASFLILLAMVFDVLDGKVARMAGTTSRFGAQIDSLSDAISFGVAPAFLAKAVAETVWPGFFPPKVLAIATAAFAICAVLRLARYNVEHDSSEGSSRDKKDVQAFAGIPTPGSAGVIASLAYLAYDPAALVNYRPAVAFSFPILCPLLGWLMVSRVPWVHFGSRYLQVRREFGYLFVVLMLLAAISLWPHECCAAGFGVYALSGPVMLLFRTRRRAPRDAEPVSKIPEGL